MWGGSGWGWSRATDLGQDLRDHGIDIRMHFGVPESEHAIAFLRYDHSSVRVMTYRVGRGMCVAIELNDNSSPVLREIADITVKRHLPAEMKSVPVEVAQREPEFPFCWRRVPAQLAHAPFDFRPELHFTTPTLTLVS